MHIHLYEIEVTDGLGLLTIGLYEMGSCFVFKKPVATEWLDCSGTGAKYFAQLPGSTDYKKEVELQLRNILYNDYTNKEEELFTTLQPLFKLFKNGFYYLTYYGCSTNKYFTYTRRSNDQDLVHFRDIQFVFGGFTEIEKAMLKQAEYNKYLASKGAQYAWDIMTYTSGNFYEGDSKVFLATQPLQTINNARVDFFVEEIKSGKRPFIITFECEYLHYDNDYYDDNKRLTSEVYVLDGHHKLLAYRKLNIYPPVVQIYYAPKKRADVLIDIEALADALYPWQMQHLLDNWDKKEDYIADLMNDPASKVYPFVKAK